MKRVKSSSLNQKLLNAIKKAGGKFSEEAKKRYAKEIQGGEHSPYHNRYRADPFVSDPEHHTPYNNGRTVNEVHIDDPIFDPIRGQHANFANNFYEWFNRYGNPFNHIPFVDREPIFWNKTYKAEKIHPQSLLTRIGWTGIWNSLTTAQKMKVFRFVYNVENAKVDMYVTKDKGIIFDNLITS